MKPLSGLRSTKHYISALVSMADDGGSTGVLRDELGVLPPGDVRQCLVALSEAPHELRDLFNYRFEEGSLAGHSFGNLFLSAVEKMTHNFDDAVRVASKVLRIRGRVIPITLDDVRLAIHWPDGSEAHGQSRIDFMDLGAHEGRPHLYLEPAAHINPAADKALREADLVVIAPGDLYTSLGALLVVNGVSEALKATPAKIVYACNLMEKPGQTTGFSVADHAAEIERLMGGARLSAVIYNTQEPPAALLEKYQRAGEQLVRVDAAWLQAAPYQVIGRPLIATQEYTPKASDALAAHRSFVRHDGKALAQVLEELL